jgi:hypothetical protein
MNLYENKVLWLDIFLPLSEMNLCENKVLELDIIFTFFLTNLWKIYVNF